MNRFVYLILMTAIVAGVIFVPYLIMRLISKALWGF